MNTHTLDTRDLDQRLNELEDERIFLQDAVDEAKTEMDRLENEDDPESEKVISAHTDALDALDDWDKENGGELAELQNLRDEVPNWRHGAALIPESDFVDYVRNFVSDVGDLPRDLADYIVIDWDATADNLRSDYSEIEYQGDTYLFLNS